MSLVVLACDPSNLQFIADVAHCSQWVAVEPPQTLFSFMASLTSAEREQLYSKAFHFLGTAFVFGVVISFILRK